jgi:hypothetical protein
MWRNSASSTRLRLAAAGLLAALALPAGAGPAGVTLPFETAQVGQGTLRFLGLRIYDATLWAPGGRWRPDAPYALELTYARKIDRSRLAASTVSEIRKQRNLPQPLLADWEKQLATLFPDVKPGDRISAIRIPGQGVSFHAGPRPLGRIGDEAFAESFFAIWLDARTSVPALRDRLLGG